MPYNVLSDSRPYLISYVSRDRPFPDQSLQDGAGGAGHDSGHPSSYFQRDLSDITDLVGLLQGTEQLDWHFGLEGDTMGMPGLHLPGHY